MQVYTVSDSHLLPCIPLKPFTLRIVTGGMENKQLMVPVGSKYSNDFTVIENLI